MKKLLLIWLAAFAAVSCAQEKQPSKPLYMWFDCEANYATLSHPDSIRYYVSKIHDMGFTDVVVDVKSIMGETLYKSDIAPYMGEWEGVTRPENYDLLGYFIEEGHKLGMRVHGSLNVFAGGHNYFDRGIIYGDHADWQSQVYTEGHTVNPAAASRYPIYRENTREYALLESSHFGTVLQMEVGAAMVGRIVNNPAPARVQRGAEKGRFEFGGSTVIVLLQKGAAVIDEDIVKNTAADNETVVHLGEKIGIAAKE